MIELTAKEKEEILLLANDRNQVDWAVRMLDKPIDEMTVRVCFKKASGRYPDQIMVYFLGDVDGRYLNKIYNLPLIAQRPGNRDECINNHFAARYKFVVYTDWDILIKDEISEGADHHFIIKLQAGKNAYPFAKKVVLQ